MGIKLQGGNDSTNLTSVTALNQLRVTTPQDSAGLSAGFVQLSVEGDAGSILGSRSVLALESSDDYRLRSGLDQTIFNATFEGTVLQTPIWLQLLSTMTTQVVGGFVSLNAGNSIATSTYAYVRTHRSFPIYGTYPMYVDMWIREGNPDGSNTVSEWGLILTTLGNAGSQQLMDAICFRRSSGGQLTAVIVNNSIDIQEILINTERVPARNGVGVYDSTQSNHYLIDITNDVVNFWINDTLVGEIKCPSAQAYFSSATALPVGFRVVNLAAVVGGARVISVGYVNVSMGDQNTNKPWSHILVGSGQGSYQTQQGSAVGPTVLRTAALSGHPASATVRLANTWTQSTAPGISNLGGLWTSPAMSTLINEAEYPIFSYLNPIGTISLGVTTPGKTLYVTGIRIGETYATAAAAGGGGMFLSFIAMPESSGSSMATLDAATTTSGKSIVLGGQGFASGDVAGTMKSGFDMSFPSPIVIPAGKYLTIVVRLLGTITSNTLVVTGSIAVNGYHE